MIIALFFFSCILVAFWGLRRLQHTWFLPELIAASAAVGFLIGTWLIFLGSLVAAYAWVIPVESVVVCGVAIYLCASSRSLFRREFLPLTQWRWVVWLISTGLACGMLWYYLSSDMLYPAANGWLSGGSAWGDLPLHTTLITHFASLPRQDLSMPLMYHAQLTYHFLIDFLSSLFMRSGFSLRASLLIPADILVFSIVQLFFFFVLRVFKSASSAALALYLFLIGGTTTGIIAFWQDWHQSGMEFLRFLSSIQIDYTSTWSRGLDFSNVVTSFILPQRSGLFGFSIFLLVATFIYEAMLEKQSRAYAVCAGFLIGLLPLAHLQTFLVGTVLLVAVALVESVRTRRVFNHYWLATLVALVLATPQFFWLTHAGVSAGFSYSHFGWRKENGESLMWFWLKNLGPAAIFLVLNFWLIYKFRLSRFIWILYTTLIALFVLGNFYIFQPAVYDNIKVFYYAYMAICWVAAYGLVRLIRAHWAWAIPVVTLTFIWTMSGILGQIREVNTQVWPFISASDLVFARVAETDIPPGALVLTAPDHMNPVSSLDGRPVLLGNEGWLSSYNDDFSQLHDDALTIFSGSPEASALLKKYGIKYVVIDVLEDNPWKANLAYFMTNYPVLFHDARWTLIKTE